MAIGKISGPMLQNNLERQGVDLSIETDLLYVDVANNRIGINTASPTADLEVSGNLQLSNVSIEGNVVRSTSGALDLGDSPSDITIGGGTSGYVLTTDGSGNLTWSSVSALSLSGDTINLGTPDDSSLYPTGAINDWTSATKVTNAIDDLNELANNIINNTAVTNIDFIADTTEGGAGTSVTLTISAAGNPNRYTINWGDGATTTGTTDTTPTHTYNTNIGSPFDVAVTAYNNAGTGAGSASTKTREDYIIIYTADPVVSFTAYDAPTGGNIVTYWDDGDTVYFQNNTTNTSGATVQYTWSWGDGNSDDVITSDSDPGGVGGGRLAHTFATGSETDVTRTVTLSLDSHNTANPGVVPLDLDASYKVYDTHTPTVTLSTTTGINEESNAGLSVTFTNTTESTIGSYANYGIQYLYTWGDGTTSTVNTGSLASGDTNSTIVHKYTLSGANQASGTPVDYTGNLRVISNHSSSPFISTDFTVHVEPDVRAIISGTAVTVSDRTGDNAYDLYNGVDYNGNNRALARVTNSTQNADSYVYDWGDSSSDDSVTEDGVSAGSIGATIDHDYTGETIANHTLTFTASGTPDLTAQTDTDTSIVFQLNSVPAAPSGLSAFTLTLADAYQGTSPKLCAGFTDNSATSPLTAGTALTTTTARRYTSGTIDTNAVNNANGGLSGTLTAVINGSSRGSKTFSTELNETGTFTSLVISQQADAHTTISASTYPTGFYQTFDAAITQALTSYSVGVNDQRLEHTDTGNSSYVAVVYDNVTATPTISNAGTLSEGTAGTYRYISGVPYYDSGSPTVVLSGVTVSNFTGQAYCDTSSPVEVDTGTNQEGTSSAGTVDTNFTYAQADGASSMLTGGVPNANTGVGSPYTLGALTVPITSSSVRTIDRVKVRATNCNGTGSYIENTTNIAVHKSSQTGISEIAIAVADSLGNGTYTDDGVRVFDFSAATINTPSFTGSTNFYTNNVYTESSDPGVEGTKEATIRLGVLKHDVTNYSSGYLPVGPNRSGDTGTQYFTFAFRRQVVANFDIGITTSGIAGMWIAAPGTGIDSSSGLNGWLDCTMQYAGAGVPGSNTGSGGNGSDGCALTGADVVSTGINLNGSYTMTLGSENMSNATGNVVLVRIALTSGQSVTALSIGVAS